MWQRFTERARRVILFGQEEAFKMNSGHVGPECLLLGLMRESEGAGAAVLRKMGVSAEQVRVAIAGESEALPPDPKTEEPSAALSNLTSALQDLGIHFKLTREFVRRVEEETLQQLRKGKESTASEPKLTPAAKRVLELAAEEAKRMRHNYIGTEHLLLALFRDERDPTARLLKQLGLGLEETRQEVLEYLGADKAEKSGSVTSGQYSIAQLQPVVDLIQRAIDALDSSDRDKLESVRQQFEELKNRHQKDDADNSSEN